MEYRWDNFVTCSSGCGCDNTVTRIFGGAAVGYATVRLFFTFLHILRSKFMSLLFKTGDKGSFSKYRPVSLLPQFSKIIEKLFNKRLDTFIEVNQVITSSQYGFRNKASTSHALLDLHEQLTKSMDKKLKTIGIFIDLKKAFDTIDHSLLIKMLTIFGIRGVASSWITSYLDKRSQYVYYNDVKSDALDISCRVPHGSILGLKLFILYGECGECIQVV